MTKSLVTYLLLLFSGLTIFAQNAKIDSLNKAIIKTDSDIEKAVIYNLLADEYKSITPEKAFLYANKALELAKKIENNIELGTAYNNLGNANIILGNYSKALDNFTKAQIVFENELLSATALNIKQVKDGLARAYGSIAFVLMEQSSYDKALEFNFKSLKIYEETKNSKKLLRIYNNIGVIYKSQSNFPKALVYYEKGLYIQEKLKDINIGTTINNIGLVYLMKKDYSMALNYFNKAKFYFDKYPNPLALADLNYNYGNYYIEAKNLSKSLEYINESLEGYTKLNNKFGIAKSYALLGTVHSNQENYKDALICIEKGLKIARELKILDQVQSFEKNLSQIYEKLNKPDLALKHYKLYSIAKDSVTNAETIKNSIRAELNFDFERKEILQKEEQEKKEMLYEEQKKTSFIKIFLSFLLTLLVSGITFLIYNRSQLKKRLTLEKELAIYEQKALHLQMNPHFIFNCLGSISSFIVQNSSDSAIKYLAKFSKLMRLTLEYSKETVIPIDKEIEILQNYLELEQLRFNNKFNFKIKKSNDIEDDLVLPPLLLQPFVENAIIHGLNPDAKTGNINVDFEINDKSLICIITDDGIGINKSKEMKKTLVKMHKSMALDITRKRLEMLGNQKTNKTDLIIEEINENGEIKGTKVTVKLPLQYQDKL
jgi:tetratricopeptide (TPR) repeat protein